VKVTVGPVTRSEARRVVSAWHSHHKAHVGERFALGAFVDDVIVGVAVWSRPVAPALATRFTWEMTRLCVGPDAPKHAASRLIGAATKVALAAGITRCVSYTRADERGTCYRAANWHPTARVKASDWSRTPTKAQGRTGWLPGLYVASTAPVDRVRWERGPSAAPADWSLTQEGADGSP
jgi:hypothetical protein